MIRIAIVGGGISGLTAAYELEKARRRNPEIDWHLYESTDRLGGIIETLHQKTNILEQGPDAWITEKPAARDLAIELGLEPHLIPSNDATRKTYIYIDGTLQPIPGHMRMMVPTNLASLDASPLFSPEAKAAYAAEITNAETLKQQAPIEDESVANFVLRHFGEEVLAKIAAPILSGIFGGDVHKLSARSVMPAFVAMERDHGSLILALQLKSKSSKQPIFTTLRDGLATLTEALIAQLPPDRLQLNHPAISLKREAKRWCLRTAPPAEKGRTGVSKKHFNHVLLATPSDTTRNLLAPLDPDAAALLPTNSSSAILITFTWPPETPITLPPGFGFLIPQSPKPKTQNPEPQLLAVTFATQKFPHRAPAGATILRAFFGGPTADTLTHTPDAELTTAALTQLQTILGPLPPPATTTLRRWPRSLPQYEVGHQTRITELTQHITTLGNLTLLGNAYNGVGLPDLIQAARTAAKSLTHKA